MADRAGALMADPTKYATAADFRRALDDRLRAKAGGVESRLVRMRRAIGFERLLVRIFQNRDSRWFLKGGYSLEVRFQDRARVTRDLDLSIPAGARITQASSSPIEGALAELRNAATRAADEYFTLVIGEPMQDLAGAPYGGARFPVACKLDERVFIEFHLDVGIGDIMEGEPEWTTGHDLLGFAGLKPAEIAMIPVPLQFAEKIHAYTQARPQGENTRVRDLVDLVLLIRQGPGDQKQVRAALKSTFSSRDSHPIPEVLSPPPESWQAPYNKLVQGMSDIPQSMDESIRIVQDYWKDLNR